MWANTCWGLLGLAVTCALAVLGLSPTYEWWRPWLLNAATVFSAASILCFAWPGLTVFDRKIFRWLSQWRLRVPWERRSTTSIPTRNTKPIGPLTADQIEFRKELKHFSLHCAPTLANAIGQVLAELKTKEADNSSRSVALHFLFHWAFSSFRELEDLKQAADVDLAAMDIEDVQNKLAAFLEAYGSRQKAAGTLNAVVQLDLNAFDGGSWLVTDRECSKDLEKLKHWKEAGRLKKCGDCMAVSSKLWTRQHRVNYPDTPQFPSPTVTQTPSQSGSVSTSPDFSHWNGVNRFTLIQAACLWAGIEPVTTMKALKQIPKAKARYQMLTEAIEGERLNAHVPDSAHDLAVAVVGHHAPDMWVFRSDLEKLADALGERPDFLRANVGQKETSENEVSTELGDLIEEARELVARCAREKPGDDDFFKRKLQTSPIFLRLYRHLSDEFKDMLLSGRIVVVPPAGSLHSGIALRFVDELDRLERHGTR